MAVCHVTATGNIQQVIDKATQAMFISVKSEKMVRERSKIIWNISFTMKSKQTSV